MYWATTELREISQALENSKQHVDCAALEAIPDMSDSCDQNWQNSM